jgi:hypothetical protein
LDGLTVHIKKAAKFVAYQWPGVIDADDAEQALYLRLLESPGSVARIKEMEDDRAKYRAIVGMANQIASKERSDYAYYKGSYRYSVAEVQGLLKAGALRGAELDPDVQTYDSEGGKPKAGRSAPPVDSAVLDLRKAFDLVRDRNSRYADAITKRYLFDEYPETQIEKNDQHRGEESLAHEMNRVNRTAHASRDDGPGTGKVLTREQARWASKEGWDADYSPVPSFKRDNHIEKEVWE